MVQSKIARRAAGVTPAQGSVKPTVGFILNKVIFLELPTRLQLDLERRVRVRVPNLEQRRAFAVILTKRSTRAHLLALEKWLILI